MTQNKHIVETHEITKTYEDNGVEVPAVRGISLVVDNGEFTAIVGPSGSGKTTFLNIISGLDSPTSGEVLLDGHPLSTMGGRALSDFRRDHVGFIFQAFNLVPVLTVEENVEYIMMLQDVPRAERHQRVAGILEQVGLKGMSNRLPTRLSGGQQQRVAIARAMVSRPRLILADEPTANLDSATGAELLDMMRELNENTGMTFLFSTHDRMIMERARRVVTLQDGQVYSDRHKA